MNIALLSGADKNAGDFLIVHRAKKLIEQEIPDCVLHEFKRNEDLESSLDEVNSCDVVLFAGGPGYMQDMYPNKMPLVGDLNRIKPPFFAMGMGAYSLSANVESYLFTDQSRTLLERFERDGFGLGCRDGLTEDILHQVGVRNTLMTGCPAWYDLDKIEAQALFRRPVQGNIDHIAISDPARPENIPLACSLVRYVVEELQPLCSTGDGRAINTQGDIWPPASRTLRHGLTDNGSMYAGSNTPTRASEFITTPICISGFGSMRISTI